MAGVDPTGAGRVIPGYTDRHVPELLAEAGFSFEQAIKICSLNATYTTFNQFKIKLVLASSSTLYQDVPFLYDVQVVAMPADVY